MSAESELITDMVAAADRLDGMAETAELMDDSANALRFRHQANELRTQAMTLLDPELPK